MSKDLIYPENDELTEAEHAAFTVSALDDLKFRCWTIYLLFPTPDTWHGESFNNYFNMFSDITISDLEHFLSTFPKK